MDEPTTKPLSDEERAEVMPALQKLAEAQDELDEAAARLGRPPDSFDFTSRCRVCSCRFFQSHATTFRCKTVGCGHRLNQHVLE